MKLDLSEILGRVGMRYPYEVDEPPLVDEDIECTKPIQGRIVFTNTADVLLIDGGVDTAVALACSRCLVYYEEPLHVDIGEQFPLETRPAGPRGRQTHIVVEEDENPDAEKLFEGPLFDLTELLRQGITLALPTRPLHSETCKGLCALCGKDLNEGPCGCEPVTTHPGLAGLAELRKTVAERENEPNDEPA